MLPHSPQSPKIIFHTLYLSFVRHQILFIFHNMLPHDYYRRLHFSPPQLFIIVTILLMTMCSCSAEQPTKIKLDKFVCAQVEAKMLPSGVSVTKADQIRFVSHELDDTVFPLLQNGAPKEFVFTVVHEASCDFVAQTKCKTSDKKDEADKTKYATSGDMCKKDNNTCKSVSVSCEFPMLTVEQLDDARLVSFKKNIQHNGTTKCAWQAFVDNARFLLPSKTKEAKVEQCAGKDNGGINTWIIVMVIVAVLLIVGAIAFVCVAMSRRKRQQAEAAAASASAKEDDTTTGDTTGQPQSSPAMTQSMFERATKSAWRMPKIIFINAGRGASKKGGKNKKAKDADDLESARDESEAETPPTTDNKAGAKPAAAATDDNNKTTAEATTPATDAISGYGEAQTSGYAVATTTDSGYAVPTTTDSGYTVPTTNTNATPAAKPASGAATGEGGTHVRSAYFA